MRLQTIFRCSLFALALLSLAACDDMNEVSAPPPSSSELPVAPVLPTYVRLSPTAPPAPQTEMPPVIEDLQHKIWRPGYWYYDSGQFTWMPGEVIAKPSFTAVWVPDHWERREYGWALVSGYWQ